MRKYVIGTLIGFCLSFAVSAHAEVITMINKVVEGTFPVTVQGSKLAVDAVVIEGSTYLPVREFGEAIGYNVVFDANLGVTLSKSVTDSTYTPPNPNAEKVKRLEELRTRQKSILKEIEIVFPAVEQYEQQVRDKAGHDIPELLEQYKIDKKTWEAKKVELKDVDAQVEEMKAELTK